MQRQRVNSYGCTLLAVSYLHDRGTVVRFPACARTAALVENEKKSSGPTQPLIQLVPGSPSSAIKRPTLNLNAHPKYVQDHK